MFDHIGGGEALLIIAQLTSCAPAWDAGLQAAGLSAGVFIEATAAQRGSMLMAQLRVSPFLWVKSAKAEHEDR